MKLEIGKKVSLVGLALAMIISAPTAPSWAGDPFRKTNPRNIGDKTEAAFNVIFKQGDYKTAVKSATVATETEPNEPLAHALRASLAYTTKDWENLRIYGRKTTEAAEKLKGSDGVRGNLYLAAGNFLEGAYVFQKEGPVSAISRLQQVFQYLDAAEKAAPEDPEVNLLKGYLNLILAVNLPFSSPEQAIERLETYASPDYLVDRGIALAYRDMKEYDKALQFMDNALKETPDNPEVQYLKGQILRIKGNADKNGALLKQALNYYNLALKKQDQLPESVQKQLNREYRKVQEEIKSLDSTAKS
ncbi:MAG: tetratricopeptide repeat protein [Chlorogloea purpurea SAG 13.99]|nr:tetratricopeptide repeat protein [Chlorogloea purpurea SAG 13.99]